MCAVSMVYAFANQLPPLSWNYNSYKSFQELVKEMEKIDIQQNNTDCKDMDKYSLLDIKIQEYLQPNVPLKSPENHDVLF